MIKHVRSQRWGGAPKLALGLAMLWLGCPAPLPPLQVATTAPGAPQGSASSAAVGSAGGTLASPDGRLTVVIPGGALSATTTLTIQPITATAPGGRGLAYRLGPEGTTFSAPVELRFVAGEADLAGTVPSKLDVASQLADGRWRVERHATWDDAAQTLTATATHFSDWSMIAGAVLRPAVAHVKPRERAEFTIATCAQQDDGELESLLYECSDELGYLTDSVRWQVNGVDDGNDTVGTVASQGSTATYVAPAKAPKPATVALSANLQAKGGGKLILISQVTVAAAPTLTGTIALSVRKQSGAAGPSELSVAAITLEPRPNNCDPRTVCSYAGSGTFTVAGDVTYGTNLLCHTARRTGTVDLVLTEGFVAMPPLFATANTFGFTNLAAARLTGVSCDDLNGGAPVIMDLSVVAPEDLTNMDCARAMVEPFTDPANLAGTVVRACSPTREWSVSWTLSGS